MIYLFGDTHGEMEINKLAAGNFPEGKDLTKNDYVIILGDFGIVWGEKSVRREQYYFSWLDSKPWTTLIINGNHDNIPRLNSFPEETLLGGKVNKLSESVYRLKNGEVFTIDDKTYFVMGGGTSIDKHYRTEGISWWPEEVPSYTELQNAYTNLERFNFSVDYMITHALFTWGFWSLPLEKFKAGDPVHKQLQMIHDQTSFHHWYCGHYHIDYTDEQRKYTVVYKSYIKL